MKREYSRQITIKVLKTAVFIDPRKIAKRGTELRLVMTCLIIQAILFIVAITTGFDHS